MDVEPLRITELANELTQQIDTVDPLVSPSIRPVDYERAWLKGKAEKVGVAGLHNPILISQGIVRLLCQSDAQLFAGWGGHPSVNDSSLLEKLSNLSQKTLDLLKVL